VQAIDPHRRNVAHAKPFRRFNATMPRDNPVGAVDQNWIDEPKLLNAGSDLPDLPYRMNAWIARPRL
jgi:hypothetical protein